MEHIFVTSIFQTKRHWKKAYDDHFSHLWLGFCKFTLNSVIYKALSHLGGWWRRRPCRRRGSRGRRSWGRGPRCWPWKSWSWNRVFRVGATVDMMTTCVCRGRWRGWRRWRNGGCGRCFPALGLAPGIWRSRRCLGEICITCEQFKESAWCLVYFIPSWSWQWRGKRWVWRRVQQLGGWKHVEPGRSGWEIMDCVKVFQELEW